MRITKLALIAACFALAGCGASVTQPSQDAAQDVIGNLKYGRDVRTGLCFAVAKNDSVTTVRVETMIVTWVPCDPKVLELIGK